MTFSSINVGDIYEEKRVVTSEAVETFARLTGDNNPLHLDEAFAAKSIFKKRVAHGLLVVSYISAILGMRFPGPGTIYMRQDSKFMAPVYIGEEIIIKVVVKEKITEKHRLVLVTQIFKDDGKLAVDGEVMVKFDVD